MLKIIIKTCLVAGLSLATLNADTQSNEEKEYQFYLEKIIYNLDRAKDDINNEINYVVGKIKKDLDHLKKYNQVGEVGDQQEKLDELKVYFDEIKKIRIKFE